MKKNITKEEYENAIARIEFIYREKELLECMSRNKIYNAHIDLPGTFGELLINIIRENKNINNLINELENSFLQSFRKDKRLYKSLKNKFDEFNKIVLNDNSNKFPKAEDNLVVADLMQYETFKKISHELFELLKRKQGNISLYGYVISLDEELQKMLTIKNKYENYNKNCK